MDTARSGRGGRRGALATHGVVVVAAVACLATQAPRWSLEAKAPVTAAAPAGKALRVTVEASGEPYLGAVGSETNEVWEDVATERTSWPGRVDFFLDAGSTPTVAQLSDRCTSGGGLCSSCDPPAGAFVRIASVAVVDVWSLTATASAPAGAGTLEVDIEASRTPRVTATRTDGTVSMCGGHVGGRPSVPGQRRFACHVDGAATVTATIRGACSGGPCPAPTADSVAIVHTVRVP